MALREHIREAGWNAVWLAILFLGGCGGGSSTTPTTPTPPVAQNRAPVVGDISVSPRGIGLMSATIFTFTAANVSDPDGDALTYSWTSNDGSPIVSSTQAASHVYARAGTFEMRLSVTDSKGLSASSVVSVSVGTLTGTWDITCNNPPPSFPLFPTQFVVSLTQSGIQLFGTISGGGLMQSFPAPPGASIGSIVRDPRQADFGVEAAFNVWAQQDSDFYFNLDADETLGSMSGASSFWCGSAIARRR
jgi:PKD repeat protein